MIPGPDIILACPHCNALARHGSLLSGNTFGEQLWTDGKRVAPMCPFPPAYVRCRSCRGFHWLDDARRVGRIPGPFDENPDAEVPPEWLAAPEVEEPTPAGYLEAIETGAIDPEPELDMRVRAMWRGNAPFREHAPSDAAHARAVDAPVDAEARRLNLEAIVDLLADADGDRLLMRAEALRELGRFDEAVAALDRVEGEGFQKVVSALRRYCEAGDPAPHVL